MRKIVIVVVVVAVSLLVVGLVPKVAEYLIMSSVVYKSAHTGAGTVVSIRRSGPQGSVSEAPAQYTVCFTINDWGKTWNEHGNKLRPQYEAAERKRERASGPRCEVFDYLPVISEIKPGDKISITYLLYNDLSISIPKINAFGVELDPVFNMRGTPPLVGK